MKPLIGGASIGSTLTPRPNCGMKTRSSDMPSREVADTCGVLSICPHAVRTAPTATVEIAIITALRARQDILSIQASTTVDKLRVRRARTVLAVRAQGVGHCTARPQSRSANSDGWGEIGRK